jgi:hypothetical protein
VSPRNPISYATKLQAGDVPSYNKKSFDMTTFSPPPKGDSNIEVTPLPGIQESIYPPQHEINVTDGGEFLDDAIRMKDQPLGETTLRDNG